MFCSNCKELFKDKAALYCSKCGTKLEHPLTVVDGPFFIKSKNKIVQVVELPDKSRQIHVFYGGWQIRPITCEDGISWEDLKDAVKIPTRMFLEALLRQVIK